MGGFSFWHLLILAAVIFIFFGKGRISDLMEDVGKGIKSFKKGISDDEPAPMKPIAHVDTPVSPITPSAQAQPVPPPTETH